MKPLHRFAAVLVVLGAGLLLARLPSIHAAERFVSRVISVHDGDTLTVEREGRAVRIRLSWVDAAEIDQPDGVEARDWLKALVLDQEVSVTVKGRSYDRLVGEVLVDGKSVNAGLLKAGHGWLDPRYSKSRVLKALEAEAREAKRGLWADQNPVAPWRWRKGDRR